MVNLDNYSNKILFHWNPELLCLGRQIGLVNSGAFGVFWAELSAHTLVCFFFFWSMRRNQNFLLRFKYGPFNSTHLDHGVLNRPAWSTFGYFDVTYVSHIFYYRNFVRETDVSRIPLGKTNDYTYFTKCFLNFAVWIFQKCNKIWPKLQVLNSPIFKIASAKQPETRC